MLTILEIEQLFAIFKQATGEASDSVATGDDDKAIRLLNEQLKELETVRGLNYHDAQFKAWRDTTMGYLERFLPPNSPHLSTFRNLSFLRRAMTTDAPWGSPKATREQLDQEHFLAACRTAEATIKAVVKYIEELGVHTEQASAKSSKARGGTSRGDVHQTFNAPVSMNQAIATGGASQNVGQVGDTIGAGLREIAEVFKQSEELTKRQIREGLAGIDTLSVEVQKPEAQRNWKSILDYGEKVLAIAGKATDLASKLAPYTPHIATLVEQAKHWLK